MDFNVTSLRKLADILGVNVADLHPRPALSVGRTSLRQLSLTTISGRSDVVRLTINKVLPMRIAVQVLALVAAGDSQEHDRALEHAPEVLPAE